MVDKNNEILVILKHSLKLDLKAAGTATIHKVEENEILPDQTTQQ